MAPRAQGRMPDAPHTPAPLRPPAGGRALQALHERAQAAGLTLRWVVPRSAIDPRFAHASWRTATPATLHPGYRSAIVLASAGPDFWRAFRDAVPAAPDSADPLDGHTERVVDSLCDTFRAADPTAMAVYPFRHERQLLGFPRLLADLGEWTAAAPFGIVVHPRAGPWWALRGALLTALALPPTPDAAPSPCPECPAPCVTACPAGAVRKSGFAWRPCADYRLRAPTCRETCLSRLACPVGPAFRYDEPAIAFHHRASLRELEAHLRPPRG